MARNAVAWDSDSQYSSFSPNSGETFAHRGEDIFIAITLARSRCASRASMVSGTRPATSRTTLRKTLGFLASVRWIAG